MPLSRRFPHNSIEENWWGEPIREVNRVFSIKSVPFSRAFMRAETPRASQYSAEGSRRGSSPSGVRSREQCQEDARSATAPGGMNDFLLIVRNNRLLRYSLRG